MFVHWDPESQEGLETNWRRRKPGMDPEHYDNLYKTFDPVKYGLDAMVEMAYIHRSSLRGDDYETSRRVFHV